MARSDSPHRKRRPWAITHSQGASNTSAWVILVPAEMRLHNRRSGMRATFLRDFPAGKLGNFFKLEVISWQSESADGRCAARGFHSGTHGRLRETGYEADSSLSDIVGCLPRSPTSRTQTRTISATERVEMPVTAASALSAIPCGSRKPGSMTPCAAWECAVRPCQRGPGRGSRCAA